MQLIPIEKIRAILSENTVIAVVGLSPKPARPSHGVARYMEGAGYHIIPVNPGQSEILGHKCYPDLHAIPGKIDIVNIFRQSAHVEPIVRDAIKIGAKVIWMQQGIINEKAARLAEEHGLVVIMDRCISTDHRSFMN
ncbi:MAG: CoA-binding protein [Desulfobulbaceae bacterium]|nr:CoA-binding protein [Desulfobulbaceae bacterium]